MFSTLPVLSVVLVAASSASGMILPHHRRVNLEFRATQPPTWATGYLEDYQTYHARYLALDCEAKHNTPFFDQCCHPLLATENLKDNRPPQCTPNPTALSSASAAYPTSTLEPGSNGDTDCDEDPKPSHTATPKSGSAPKDALPKAPEPKSSSSSSSSTHPAETPKAPAPKVKSPTTPTTTTTTTSSTPKSTPKSSSGSGDGSSSGSLTGLITGGIATFFTQNGVAGACGTVHQDSDIVCALDTPTYANGQHCGQKVAITNLKTGQTVDVTVADECPTCDNSQSIDLSTGAFAALGGVASDGTFPIAWKFL